MNSEQKTPRSENLQNLTYSELRKEASKYGIKRRMKSEKLIAAILSLDSNPDDVFSTPAAKEINSCKKNKEKMFDEGQMTPLATPRRGTYSVETPFSVKTEDLSSVSLAVNASDLDLSNITVSRGSERKLRPRKVSFMSPAVTPRTPKNQSLRNRPKTPIASRTPLDENISSGQHKRNSFEDSVLDSTPQAKIAKGEGESDMKSNALPDSVISSNSLDVQEASGDAEISQADLTTHNVSSNLESSVITESTQKAKKNVGASKSKLSHQKVKTSAAKEIVKQHTSNKKGITLSDKNAVVTKEPTSVKRGTTPNFRRIHKKAFDKMESIDDYEKRKLLNSAKKINQRPNFKSKVTKAKSKIPAFGGIPFIPSVDTSYSMRLNSKENRLGSSVGESKAVKENISQFTKTVDLKVKDLTRKGTPQPKSKFEMKGKNLLKRESPQSVKSKSKFDLKASLSRKLTYKPYKGPLRPLAESNNLSSASVINAKEPVINKVVKENRSQTRSMIRGVRMNKRFELQMRNRK